MWLLDPSFCNHGILNKFDLQKNIFSSVNKDTCVLSCYYQYFLHRVLIPQCPWKEKTGCQFKAESTIITCLEIDISFSQMTSSFHSSVNMLFSYILKKKRNAILDVIKGFFFFSVNIVRSHKTWVTWFFSSILHCYREENIVKGKFPSSRHYSIMKSHFPFNKNNP